MKMKSKKLAIGALMAVSVISAMMPVAAYAKTGKEAECICTVRCAEKINDTCHVCREDIAQCQGKEEKKTEDSITEKESPLTPDGNMNLVDDYGASTENKSGKQFITFTAKNGNYFYMIIDRDDSGNETVHFLNMVDESDLLSLMDEDEIKELNRSSETDNDEQKKAEEEEKKKAAAQKKKQRTAKKKSTKKSSNGALVLLLLAGVAGTGIYAYKKFGSKGSSDDGPDPDAGYDENKDYVDQINEDLAKENEKKE